ncbi:MAG: hypothetical protein ABEN55_12730 [Bradymonadaceae bacterium]
MTVEPTTAGRLAAAAMRFARWTPIAAFGLGLLFMPDYLCHYREQQAASAMFWVVIGAGALFIGAVGAFVRFSRRDRWTFDSRSGEIVVEAQPLVGRAASATADLGEWRGLEAVRSPMLSQSRIELRFDDRPDEEICESRLGWATIADVWDELDTFVGESGLNVDIDETSAESEP